MKILIVDDSKMSRLLVRKALPDHIKTTAEFKEADNGETGIEIYKQWLPDLVLLDLTMPGLTGYEVLEHLKNYDENACVVIVSADIQQTAVQKVMELGALAHVSKPPEAGKIEALFNQLEKKLAG